MVGGLQLLNHTDSLVAMSNSAPTLTPPPEGGEPEETTTVHVKTKEIESAAEEGRLSITPADLSTKVIEELATRFGPKKVVDKLEGLLKATKTMAVGGRPLEVPDFKTQLDSLKLLLQYQIGMPVARTEAIVHNVDTMQTLENKMQKSPALRRAVGRMLDKSKEEDGEIIEVPAEAMLEGDEEEAEEALQEVPDQPDTPVEAEVISRSMGEMLRSKGNRDTIEKWSS